MDGNVGRAWVKGGEGVGRVGKASGGDVEDAEGWGVVVTGGKAGGATSASCSRLPCSKASLRGLRAVKSIILLPGPPARFRANAAEVPDRLS